MKTIANWVVYLYPREWRHRYEPKLRALLEDVSFRWPDALDLLKEAIKMQFWTGLTLKAAVCGLAAAAIAGVVLWLSPASYESQAVVSTMPEWSVRDRPLTDWVNELKLSTMRRENLVRVMEASNLYPDLRREGRSEDALKKTADAIQILSGFGTIAGSGPVPNLAITSLSFRYPDPLIARQVTRDLVAAFIDENIRRDIARQNAGRIAAGENPQERVDGPLVVAALVSPATVGQRSGPKPATVIGLATAEGSQLGLIFAMIRRRKVPATPAAV